MPKRVVNRGPADDGELRLVDGGWICPGCGATERVFYGLAPERRCYACWQAAHPFDPHVG